MTGRALEYVRVSCSAGHRHRRYPRWSEVDPSARLPEQQWRWRWRLDRRCAVAVPESPEPKARFEPCSGEPVSGMDLCPKHARGERRVPGRGTWHYCEAALLMPTVVDSEGSG